MIKLSLCWNQVVRWLRRDISKIIILCIVWEIFFQNEQKYSCRGPELIMLGPQDTRLVPWLIMPGHRLLCRGPNSSAGSMIGVPRYISGPRLIMSGTLPVMPSPEISMSGPRLIMSGPLFVMCGPRDNYVGPLLTMSGPLTYYFEASR